MPTGDLAQVTGDIRSMAYVSLCLSDNLPETSKKEPVIAEVVSFLPKSPGQEIAR